MPAHRLPARARGLFRVTAALGVLPVLAVALVAGPALPDGWRTGVLVALLVLAALHVAIVPEVRWRRWRYEVRDEEIDLQHGTLVVRRTLIPIRRVQHVDTQTGPVQSSFGLSAVSFHTAAGASSIPALDREEAERVRARVAELARTRDDT
jgi:hypothetical protein